MTNKTSDSAPCVFNYWLIAIGIFTVLFACMFIPAWINTFTEKSAYISGDGQYTGRDFTYFYTATKQSWAGNVIDLYSVDGLIRAMEYLMPADMQKGTPPWPYPPHTMFLVAPLAVFSYFPALAIWLFLSFALPMWVLWRYWNVGGIVFLLAMLNINVLYCIMMGQVTLLLAGFVGLGIALIPKRPVIAAICFAITTIKPQIALLIPIGLMLGGYWRVFAYTIMSTFILIALSCLVFGWEAWLQLMHYSPELSKIYFDPKSWYLTLYCTYRGMLILGFSPNIAIAAHAVIALIAIYYFQYIWRKEYALPERWLALGLAAELLTPYSYMYDAPWVVIPLMAWMAYRRAGAEISMLEYSLFAVHSFAFIIMSIWAECHLLMIGSAILLLWAIKKGASVEAPYFSQMTNR